MLGQALRCAKGHAARVGHSRVWLGANGGLQERHTVAGHMVGTSAHEARTGHIPGLTKVGALESASMPACPPVCGLSYMTDYVPLACVGAPGLKLTEGAPAVM